MKFKLCRLKKNVSEFIQALFIVITIMNFTACQKSTNTIQPGALPGIFYGGEVPQLDLGGADFNWTWNDPHVLKIGQSEYWMYASATDAFIYPVRLYRLTSADGINWTRNPIASILPDSADGEWDAGGMETPAVVFFNGKYHLFYTGYKYKVGTPEYNASSPYDSRIGHAVSDDGALFTRVSINPVVAPSGVDSDPGNDWSAFIVAEPGPVVLNNQLYLYFTAVGADSGLGTSLQVIGLTRTSDVVSWESPQLALKPDQTVYPRGEGWVGYSTPNAVVIEGTVHLFFDVAHQPDGGSWLQLRLHHASSPDGLTQWEQDSTHIRKAGDFNWAVNEIRSPSALLDGTTLKLYFAGHELDGIPPEHFAIGLMTCVLPIAE